MKLTVKLAYGSVDELLLRYGHQNFTPEGLFVRSREPKPAGTRVVLKLQLSHGELVLQGAGKVAWARAPGDPAGPPGMGVELETIDPAGRRLLQRAQAGQLTGLIPGHRPLDIPPPPAQGAREAPLGPGPLVVRLGEAPEVPGTPLPEEIASGPSEELLLPPEAGFDDEFNRLLQATPGPVRDFEATRPVAALDAEAWSTVSDTEQAAPQHAEAADADPEPPPRSLWSRLKRAVAARRGED